MSKRTVHMEVNDITGVDCDGLNRGLNRLAHLAEESYYLEDILDKAMQSLYKLQPNGEQNYNNKEPRIGHVWLSRFNNGKPGNTNIEYTPSDFYKERWRYIQKTIGTINLIEKKYSAGWNKNYEESFHQIPEVLMKDTETVMERLGLTREQ